MKSIGRKPVAFSLAAFLVVVNLEAGPAASNEPVSTTSPGRLSVTSDPAGAGVFLDGRFVGRTPIDLDRLAAGDHRVRLVKDGYLENGRLVTLTGERHVLRVNLTPRVPSTDATAAAQIGGVRSGGGGGSRKGLWIGLAAAGAGAAVVAFALKGRNSAPTVASVGVSPNEVGLAGATNFSFTAVGASDPDGDSLSYTWDFGDGGSGTGSTVSHTFASAGARTVTVTVSDGKASATATGSVTIRDLSGSWTGVIGVSPLTLTLTQTNTSISGTWTTGLLCAGQVVPPATVAGSVSVQKNLQLTLAPSTTCAPIVLSGSLDAAVNTVSGAIVSGATLSPQTFSVTRR